MQRQGVHEGFPNRLKRASREGSLCGSAGGHASLRKFAEEYTFGTTARLGRPVPPAGQPVPIAARNPDRPVQVTEGWLETVGPAQLASTGVRANDRTAIASPKASVTQATDATEGRNTGRRAEGAAGRDAACDGSESGSRIAGGLPMGQNAFLASGQGMTFAQSAKAVTDWRGDSESRERAEGGRTGRGRRRERGGQLFGEGAPRTLLRVRERVGVERRVMQKRLRECVSVDALAGMLEGMMATGRDAKKGRACERDAAVSADKPSDGGGEREGDDDAASELSFLVHQCDLEPDSKHSDFMPYIT